MRKNKQWLLKEFVKIKVAGKNVERKEKKLKRSKKVEKQGAIRNNNGRK